MQGPDPDHPNVIASPKHFAVHSGPESTRHEANVYVTPHDLEDTYLPAFRAAIVEGHAGSIMCLQPRQRPARVCQRPVVEAATARCVDVRRIRRLGLRCRRRHQQKSQVRARSRSRRGCRAENGRGQRVPRLRFATSRAWAIVIEEAYERGLIGMADLDRALIRLFSARYRVGDLPAAACHRVASHALAGDAHDGKARRTGFEDGGEKPGAAEERWGAALQRRETGRRHRAPRRFDPGSAWELLLVAVEPARLDRRRSAPGVEERRPSRTCHGRLR